MVIIPYNNDLIGGFKLTDRGVNDGQDPQPVKPEEKKMDTEDLLKKLQNEVAEMKIRLTTFEKQYETKLQPELEKLKDTIQTVKENEKKINGVLNGYVKSIQQGGSFNGYKLTDKGIDKHIPNLTIALKNSKIVQDLTFDGTSFKIQYSDGTSNTVDLNVTEPVPLTVDEITDKIDASTRVFEQQLQEKFREYKQTLESTFPDIVKSIMESQNLNDEVKERARGLIEDLVEQQMTRLGEIEEEYQKLQEDLRNVSRTSSENLSRLESYVETNIPEILRQLDESKLEVLSILEEVEGLKSSAKDEINKIIADEILKLQDTIRQLGNQINQSRRELESLKGELKDTYQEYEGNVKRLTEESLQRLKDRERIALETTETKLREMGDDIRVETLEQNSSLQEKLQRQVQEQMDQVVPVLLQDDRLGEVITKTILEDNLDDLLDRIRVKLSG